MFFLIGYFVPIFIQVLFGSSAETEWSLDLESLL